LPEKAGLQRNDKIYKLLSGIFFSILIAQGLFQMVWLCIIKFDSGWLLSLGTALRVLSEIDFYFVIISTLGFTMMIPAVIFEKVKDNRQTAYSIGSMVLLPWIDIAFSLVFNRQLGFSGLISRFVIVAYLGGMWSFALSALVSANKRIFWVAFPVLLISVPVYLLARTFEWFPISGYNFWWWHALLAVSVANNTIEFKKTLKTGWQKVLAL
jgi:hypothetical protein